MILEERGTLKPLSPEYTGSGIDEWGEQDELRHPYRVIHYYYPIDGIAEEVYKRTSVIGKTRRTKDGKSLMSDIALTPDEREEFMSLCRNASTEVYSVIEPFIDDGVLSCFFDEDDPGCLPPTAYIT